MGKNVVREDVVKISYEIAGESKLQSLSKQMQGVGKGAAESVAKADASFQKLGGGASDASQKISRFGTSAKDSLKGIGTGADSASSQIKKLSGNAQLLSKNLESAGKKLSSISKSISSAGNKLSVGVTAPIIGAATASVKMATDAATSYAKVQTIADSSKLSYTQLVNGVQKASNATGIAVTDFNEALYQSLSAGVDSGKAIGFTTNMAKLAKGGFTSLDSAVDVVTSSLNAYGMSADKATSVADKLITTQNIGKTTVDLLSSSLGMVIPTAKAFGVNLDTVCAGMADLTKNGIQTAEATTYMNAMFNELGKSGTVADKALRAATKQGFTQLLAGGKSVTDVLAILQRSAKKSGKSLADMFGTAEGGKAALTIMKDGGTEFNGIVKSMASSAGATEAAFKKMNATPAAKFQKELNKLKNQGIEVGTKLLPIVGKGLGYVDKLLDAMGKLSTSQQSFLLKMAGGAALLGPVMKGIAVPIGGISKILSFVSKKAGKTGAAAAVSEVASASAGAAGKVGLLSKAGTALSGVFAAIPLPAKIALGVGAAAAIGIGLAVKHASDEAAKADLAKRFGNVTLSAKECEDAAKQLSATPWTFKLDAVNDAKSKIDGLKQSVQSASQELQKTEWKASMGLKLSDDDKSGFQQSADSLAENAVKYLEQKHYTANLAVSAVMMPGSTDYSQLTNLTDKFYSDQQSKAQEMGDSLKSTVSDALKDGVLSADEIGNIQGLQTSIQGAVNKASSEKYTASLKALQVNATAGGLTADSFKNLTTEIGKQTSASLGKADESLKVVISELDMQLADGAIDKGTYDKLVKSAQNSLNQRKTDLQMKNYSITMEPLAGKYKDATSSISKGVSGIFSKKNFLSSGFLGGDFTSRTISGLHSVTNQVDSATRDGLKQMLAAAQPQTNDMETTKQKWTKEGKVPPTEFMKSLQSTFQMEVASGDFTHQWDVLAGQISGSKELQEQFKKMEESGVEFPRELSDALKSEYGLVYEAGKGLIQKTKPEPSMVDNVKSAVKEAGFDISDSLAKSINDKGTDVTKQVTDLMGTLNDGYGLKSGEIVALYSDLGLTIPKSLADGIAKGTPGAQRQMAQLVTDLEGGKQLNVDQIDSFFSDMGKTIPYAISHQLALAKNPVQKQLTQFLSDMYGGKSLNESDIKTMFHGLNVQTADGLARPLADKGPAAQMQVTKEVTALSQGVKLGAKDIDSVFSSLDLKIPKGISDVVSKMKSASSQLGTVNVLGKLYSGAQLQSTEFQTLLQSLKVKLPAQLTSAVSQISPAAEQSVASLFQSMQSGVKASSEQLTTMFSSLKMDAPKQLINGMSEMTPYMQSQAAQLVASIGTAADSQRPALIAKMAALGGEPMKQMLSSMSMALRSDGQLIYTAGNKAGTVVKTMDAETATAKLTAPMLLNILNSGNVAKTAVDIINSITSSSTVKAPGMDFGSITSDAYAAGRAALAAYRSGLGNAGTVQKAEVSGAKNTGYSKIRAFAVGGVINHKTLSWVGEEPGHPEVIIPTNPSRRNRALSLWQQAGDMLGIQPQNHADGGIVPLDDVTAYHPDYRLSGSKSYDDHSTYAPQFTATFGANTPSNRDMERLVKKWVAESIQDALNSRDRRVPAEMIV